MSYEWSDIGSLDTELCDCSSGDYTTVNTGCRGVSVDVDGVVKYAQKLPDTNDTHVCIRQLYAGQIYPIKNVVKVFKYYTGTTSGATVFSGDGSAQVVGMRLEL
jgi:hypothetical protein